MKIEDDIKQAVETMKRGGVILYPTDTVWGLGCDATNAEAVVAAVMDVSKHIVQPPELRARQENFLKTATNRHY